MCNLERCGSTTVNPGLGAWGAALLGMSDVARIGRKKARNTPDWMTVAKQNCERRLCHLVMQNEMGEADGDWLSLSGQRSWFPRKGVGVDEDWSLETTRIWLPAAPFGHYLRRCTKHLTSMAYIGRGAAENTSCARHGPTSSSRKAQRVPPWNVSALVRRTQISPGSG